MNAVSVVLVAFTAIAQKEVSGFGDLDDHPLMRSVQKACQEKAPVEKHIYDRALMGDLQGDARDLQCYIKCVFEISNTMDVNGKIDMTEFINGMIPEAKAFYGPRMFACQDEVDDPDKCVKAMKIYQCFKVKSGDKYYFI